MIGRQVATCLFTVTLRAFPAAERAVFAADAIDTFVRAWTSHRAESGWRAAHFTGAACIDAVRAGLEERWRVYQGRNPRRGGAMRIGFSWLDVKLGLRMLARYPGLSFAGGLGIVLVVLCGILAGIFDSVINGTLPFDRGERIVSIENRDTRRNEPAAHDFESWRDLTTVSHVGAYRIVARNIAAPGQRPEAVRMAEISASSFTIAGVPPLLGRYLVAADEQRGAAPVVVIREDEWRRRFAGDPDVVGGSVRVGDLPATIVGVMPKTFGFPVNETYWMPLHLDPTPYATRLAPPNMPYKAMPHGAVVVFGRLEDGVPLAAAQAELDMVGRRLAANDPVTHARIRPRVLPYTRWYFAEQHDGEIFLVWSVVALLLGVVGANVAVLVYARTATRGMEIALRTAIGASRMRIVGQMFIEGLVLSAAAAAAGLTIAAVTRRELSAWMTWDQMPFWVDTRVTSSTVLVYVSTLAVLGAVVVGAIPALQATGRRAQTGLQHAAVTSSQWKIGRTYGALIVVQVALAVAILPYALATAWTSFRAVALDPGFPASEFLTARVESEQGQAAGHIANERAELARQLRAEPGVSAVTFLATVPGNEPTLQIEIEDDGVHEIGVGTVGVDVFEAFGVPVLAGRRFDARDADGASRQVIINRTFAREAVRGNPIGRRVREAASGDDAKTGPWLEIAGVVEDFPVSATKPAIANARIYRPAAAADPRFGLLAVRFRADAATRVSTRLRDIATAVDPDLLVRDVRTMDALLRDRQVTTRVGAWASGLATLSLLLLSATGLYALMAFTVTQRRREIGIRLALGAPPRAVIRGVLSRALGQLTIGIAIGAAIAAAFNDATASEFTGGAGLTILPAVATLVLAIGLAAATAPARRGLRIEPTEALKDIG